VISYQLELITYVASLQIKLEDGTKVNTIF